MLLQQHSSTAWASDETMQEDRSLKVTAVLSNLMPGMSRTGEVKADSGGKGEQLLPNKLCQVQNTRASAADHDRPSAGRP